MDCSKLDTMDEDREAADLVDTWLKPEANERAKLIVRIRKTIDYARRAPAKTVGYEDERTSCADVRAEMAEIRKRTWQFIDCLCGSSVEVRAALRGKDFDLDEPSEWMTSIFELYFALGDTAVGLPGTKGGRKVEYRKHICATACLSIFREIWPGKVDSKNPDLLNFAGDLYGVIEGEDEPDMEYPIRKALELGY